ncbi:MAG: hypothetical protein ABFS86_18100 [Planctomycetota bacterium]
MSVDELESGVRGGDRRVLMQELGVMAAGALLFLLGRALEKRT